MDFCFKILGLTYLCKIVDMARYTQNYSEIKAYKPITIRDRVRNFALDCLSIQNSKRSNIDLLKKPKVQFLYIHHVFEDEKEPFRRFVKKLSEYYEFVSYSKACEIVLQNDIDKPYLCFSSDDGFKNNLNAVEILNEFGVSACFFVNPDTIGLTDYSQAEQFCKSKLSSPAIEFMTWEDLRAIQDQGHEIGIHTMGHVNVAKISIEEFEKNLDESIEVFKDHNFEIKHFAYPYGRFFHFNQAAMDLVFDKGFKTCATAERGCHVQQKEPIQPNKLLIRRDQIVCDWKLTHCMYFLINAAKNAKRENSFSPY